jgi:hypothetical protein
LYTKLFVNKYLGDARDQGGRVVPIPFEHTVVSGETGGASAGVQDLVNLCVLPANCEVVNLEFVAEALWASAGVNGTLQLGDSGDDDRYLTATELYTATPGGPIATEGMKRSGLADTGQNYKPTADTIVQAKYKTANPVVGKKFKGCFFIVPGA